MRPELEPEHARDRSDIDKGGQAGGMQNSAVAAQYYYQVAAY